MEKNEVEIVKLKFGENLRKIREGKKLSLLQLSYNCSLDESNISKIEHGKFDIRLSTIIELANGLEVHQKKLLDFDLPSDEWFTTNKYDFYFADVI